VTEDNSAVSVRCDYNAILFKGYRAYIQNVIDISFTFIETTVSGGTVTVNRTGVGEHLVFVYPMWKPNSRIPDGRLEPAHRAVYNLTGN